MRQLSGGYRRGGGVIGWSGPVAVATAGGVRKRCRAAWSPRCVDGGSSCWSFDTGYRTKARRLSSDATVECTNVSVIYHTVCFSLFRWANCVVYLCVLESVHFTFHYRWPCFISLTLQTFYNLVEAFWRRQTNHVACNLQSCGFPKRASLNQTSPGISKPFYYPNSTRLAWSSALNHALACR